MAKKPIKPTKDRVAEVVLENKGLAIKIANKLWFSGKILKLGSYEDAIQDAMMFLARAAHKFDHTRGYQFSTYATWVVGDELYRKANQSGLIRVPNHAKGEDRPQFKFQMLNEEIGVDHELPDKKIDLELILKTLNRKERSLLKQRFGIGRKNEVPTSELAKKMGVKEEYVRHKIRQAIRKLKENWIGRGDY